MPIKAPQVPVQSDRKQNKATLCSLFLHFKTLILEMCSIRLPWITDTQIQRHPFHRSLDLICWKGFLLFHNQSLPHQLTIIIQAWLLKVSSTDDNGWVLKHYATIHFEAGHSGLLQRPWSTTGLIAREILSTALVVSSQSEWWDNT